MWQAQHYLSVSEFNQQLKFHVEDAFFHCLVEGEISNVIRAQSGHIYFNLKDESSLVRCVVWRTSAMGFQQFIENGAKVEIQGKLSLYVPRGDYQLVISRLAPLGRGNLYMAFEQLREKLHKEGLFSDEWKKAIPKHPKKIGIITSPNAAALQDVLKVLQSHRDDIAYQIYPTLVQGEEAALQIEKAIEFANRANECDVILLVRGGGSIEDLWCFNDERVVRAIFASQLPVITGIGHETDTTLSDFVADLRAPTPTAAAKLSSVSKQEVMQLLDRYEYQLQQLMQQVIVRVDKQIKERVIQLSYLHPLQKVTEKLEILSGKEQQLQLLMKTALRQYKQMLVNVSERLHSGLLVRKQKELQQRLDVSELNLNRIINNRHQSLENQLRQQASLLDTLSPLKVMARGYSVTQKVEGEKKIGMKGVSVVVGDELSTLVESAEIYSTVTKIIQH